MASDSHKLESEIDDSVLRSTASALTPVDDSVNQFTLGTIPKINIGLQTHGDELEDSESEAKSGSSRGESVGWVYHLKKPQLIEELGKLGLNTNGKSDDLRKRYVDFLRIRDPNKTDAGSELKAKRVVEQQTHNLSKTPPSQLNISLPLMDEAISIREILGLSPNADVNTVKRVLTSVVNTSSYDTDTATNRPIFPRERFPAPSLSTDTRVTFSAKGNLSNTGIPPQPGKPKVNREIQSLPEHLGQYSGYCRNTIYDRRYVPETLVSYPAYNPNTNREIQSVQNPLGNNGMTTSHVHREIPPVTHSLGFDPTQNYSANREIRSGNYPSVMDIPQNSNSTAMVCNMVRKWNISYDGDRNPITFLERLGELMDCYNVVPDEIIRALPEILKGKALLWYRNNRELWRNFADFQRSFELQYLPPGYSKNLDDEIRLRTQGEEEPFRDFLVAILTLIRRRGGYLLPEKIDRVYQNMKPEYKRSMRREQCQDLNDLIREAEHVEGYERAKRWYRPPPNPAQTLVPEAAYYGKHRAPRYPNKVDMLYVRSPDTRNHDSTYNNPTEVSRGYLTQKNGTKNPSTGQQPKFNNFQRKGGWPRNFRKNEDEVGSFREPPLVTENSKVGRNDSFKDQGNGNRLQDCQQTNPIPPKQELPENGKVICWNCDEEGHKTFQCMKPTVLKCFFCRKPGIRTVHCQCRQGNDPRASD